MILVDDRLRVSVELDFEAVGCLLCHDRDVALFDVLYLQGSHVGIAQGGVAAKEKDVTRLLEVFLVVRDLAGSQPIHFRDGEVDDLTRVAVRALQAGLEGLM